MKQISEQILYQGKTKKGNDLVIRYINKKDAENQLNFINLISQEKTYVIFQGEQLTLEEEQKYVDSKVEGILNNKSIFLLALIDNKIVGSSSIDMDGNVSSHVGSFGIIVSKSCRGEGIGNILLKTVLKEAKAKLINLKIVVLSVFSNNPIAQKLYLKNGFKEYGILPKGIKHRNKFVDSILMYKNI
ncbi:MAG: GNAT family N-acetyltransferase [Candidatus Shapirobacteria bacterium]|nr:GNAT family N-acetyltransferase [Candidatus Shapirobacteria bacterium]